MGKPAGRRRASTAIAAVCAALAVFVLLTALGAGDGKRNALAHRPGAQDLYAFFMFETPHVLSSYTSYSTEGLGTDLQPSWPTPRAVLGATALNGPITRYKRYAVAQLGVMETQIEQLEHALATNDLASSKAAWSTSYASYLRLGGVYLTGQVAALNEAIDGTPGGLPGGVSDPRFEGLHRIEYGLWTGQQPRTLLSLAQRLDSSVHRLRTVLPSVKMTTLEYGTRAHEILEDALRDLLSGVDVPWSGEGVLGTDAGLGATEEIISTLRSFFVDEESETDNLTPVVQAEHETLRGAFRSIAEEHGGRLPTNEQLTQRQSELLDGTLGGALEALSRVPVVLEAEAPVGNVKIPSVDSRIDP
jgi:high-affinity iron transporter